MKAIELFVGAGGLALGTTAAGFRHELVLDWNRDACNTIRENQARGFPSVVDWNLVESDAHGYDFTRFQGIDLVAGGPPCQPFSIGGKHAGATDHRNLFPEMARAVRETQPKAVIVENVRGLLRPKFAKFFEYVLLQLSHPELIRTSDETWISHLSRLEKHHTSGTQRGLTYNIVFRCVNAADFGVPQKRHRVFLVGFRSDLEIEWSFPNPTHSLDALLYDQYVTGDYWERHRIPKPRRLAIHEALKSRVDRLRCFLFPPPESPWLTVRDALSGLPEPRERGGDESFRNHVLNPGARAYTGHTGSPLDEPAKTLKAGDHGVPGGENMLTRADGSVRYFTVRESARLQTFPDDYRLDGSWTEAMRQLGNAVPAKLAEAVAQSVHETLS
jgi:DNA (cytosine-5)-methyltransferase 1